MSRNPMLQKKTPEPFGSSRNLWTVGLFSFALSFGQTSQPLFIWYLSSFGMNFIFLSLVLLIATIPQTYTTVLIGYYGDKLVSKYGRRKPVVLMALIAQMVCLCLLAVPVSYQQQDLFHWSLIWYSLFVCFGICGNTALSSWFIESTVSTEDYVLLQTKAINIGKLLGGIVGAGSSYGISASSEAVYFAFIWILLLAPSLFFLIKDVPNKLIRSQDKQPDIIPSLRTCMRSSEFKTIFLNRIILFAAIAIGASANIQLAIFSFNQLVYYKQISIYIIISITVGTLIGVLLNYSLKKFIEKYGKLATYRMLTYIAAALSCLTFPLTLFKDKTSFYLFTITNILLVSLVFPLTLIDNFFTRGLRRENMYQTALALPSSLVISIGQNLPLVILYLTGFVAGSNEVDDDQVVSKFLWNEGTIWQFRIYASVLVSVLCFASLKVLQSYTLTDEKAAQINGAVNVRDSVSSNLVQEASVEDGSRIGSPLTKETFAPFHQDVPVVTPISNSSSSSNNITSTDRGISKDSIVSTVDVVPELDDLMFMNNFSKEEVVEMRDGGVTFLDRLTANVYASIFLSLTIIVILGVACGLQLAIDQTSYAIINITIILIQSLYLGYEIIRLVNLKRMSGFDMSTLNMYVNKANDANISYDTKLSNLLRSSGVDGEASTAVSADTSSNSSSNSSGKEEDSSFYSSTIQYKFILLGFLLLTIYGGISCSLLTYRSKEPHSHGGDSKPPCNGLGC